MTSRRHEAQPLPFVSMLPPFGRLKALYLGEMHGGVEARAKHEALPLIILMSSSTPRPPSPPLMSTAEHLVRVCEQSLLSKLHKWEKKYIYNIPYFRIVKTALPFNATYKTKISRLAKAFGAPFSFVHTTHNMFSCNCWNCSNVMAVRPGFIVHVLAHSLYHSHKKKKRSFSSWPAGIIFYLFFYLQKKKKKNQVNDIHLPNSLLYNHGG